MQDIDLFVQKVPYCVPSTELHAGYLEDANPFPILPGYSECCSAATTGHTHSGMWAEQGKVKLGQEDSP